MNGVLKASPTVHFFSALRDVAEMDFTTCHMDGRVGHLFISPMGILRQSWRRGMLGAGLRFEDCGVHSLSS